MEEKNNILYVGNKPGTNDVDCYHKKDITKNIFIEASSNAMFAGPITVSGTMTVESGATVVIV